MQEPPHDSSFAEQAIQCLFELPGGENNETNSAGPVTKARVLKGIITNPQAIQLLFQEFSSFESYQIEVVSKLCQVIRECKHNGTLLVHKNKCSPNRENADFDLINNIIHYIIKYSILNIHVSSSLLALLDLLISAAGSRKLNVEHLFSNLSTNYSDSQLANPSLLNAAMEVLKILIVKREDQHRLDSYFYFSPRYCTLSLTQDRKTPINWPFMDGYSIVIWFRAENLAELRPALGYDAPILFKFYSIACGGFEAFFSGNTLIYRTLPAGNYTKPVEGSNGIIICECVPGTWYMLGLTHERPLIQKQLLYLVINDQIKQPLPVDYPKFNNKATIDDATFAQNFAGQISSILVFSKFLSQRRLIRFYQGFPLGIHKSELFKTLAEDGGGKESGGIKFMEKKEAGKIAFDKEIMEKLYLFYSPLRVHNNVCYNCVSGYDSQLIGNCGVMTLNYLGNRMKYYGGITSILPFLYFIRFAAKSEGCSLLNLFLSLVEHIIKNKGSEVTEDDHKLFWKVFGHLLLQLPPSFVNVSTIDQLINIRFNIQDDLMNKEFFKTLMRTCDFWIQTDIETQKMYWDWMENIYGQNPIFYHKIVSIQYLLDIMYNMSEIGGFCCSRVQHSMMVFHSTSSTTAEIHSGRLITSESPKEVYKLEEYISPIVGIIKFIFTNGGDPVAANIGSIVKALTLKSSHCFYLQLLLLVKSLLSDSMEESPEYLSCASPYTFAMHFLNADGLKVLLWLCTNKTPDIRALSLKLIDILASYRNLIKYNMDKDIVIFLSNLILPSRHEGEICISSPVPTGIKEERSSPTTLSEGIWENIYESPGQTSEGCPPTSDLQRQVVSEGKLIEERIMTNRQVKLSVPEEMKGIGVMGKGFDQRISPKSGEGAQNINISGQNINISGENINIIQSENTQHEHPRPSLGLGFEGKGREGDDIDRDHIDNRDKVDIESTGAKISKSKPPRGPKKFGGKLSLEIEESYADTPPHPPIRRGVELEEEECPKYEEVEDSSRAPISGMGGMYKPPPAPKNKHKKVSFQFGEEGVEEEGFSIGRQVPQVPKGKGKTFGFPLSLALGGEESSEELEEEKAEVGDVGESEGSKAVAMEEEEEGEFHIEPPPIKRGGPGFGGGGGGKKRFAFNIDIPDTGDPGDAGDTGTDPEFIFATAVPNPRQGGCKMKKRFDLTIAPEEINENYDAFGAPKIDSKEFVKQELEDLRNLAGFCVAAMKRESPIDPIEYYRDGVLIRREDARELEHKDPSSISGGAIYGLGDLGELDPELGELDPELGELDPELRELHSDRDGELSGSSNRNLKYSEEESTGSVDLDEGDTKRSLIRGGELDPGIISPHDIIPILSSPTVTTKRSTQMEMEAEIEITTLTPSQDRSKPPKSTHSITGNGVLEQIEQTDLVSIYDSIMEWVLSKQPAQLYANIMIDETDKIYYPSALSIMMKMVNTSNSTILKQKALLDLYVLAQYSNENIPAILSHPQFFHWILNLLLPFQVDISHQTLGETGKAVLEMGNKLFTLLVSKYMEMDKVGYKVIEYLVLWPKSTHLQKDENGGLIYSKEEQNSAKTLIRVLLKGVLDELPEIMVRNNLQSIDNISWFNIVNIVHAVNYLLFGFVRNDVIEEKMDKDRSVFRWSHKYIQIEEGNMVDINILHSLFNSLKPLWEHKFVGKGPPSKELQQMRTSASGSTNLTFQGAEEHIQYVLQNVKGYEYEKVIKLLLTEPTSLPGRGGSRQHEEYFIKSIVNICCATISYITDPQQLVIWLDRLQKLGKYLMLLSESWLSRNKIYFIQVHKKITIILAFIISFLQREMELQERTIVERGLVEECLLGLIIYLLQINSMTIYKKTVTPGIDAVPTNQSACQELLLKILTTAQDQPLFPLTSIPSLKSNNYEEITNVLKSERSKRMFANNPAIQNIIAKHFNFPYMEYLLYQMLAKTEQIVQTNEQEMHDSINISHKMQTEINDTIVNISDSETKRRVAVSILENDFERTDKKAWKNLQIRLRQWKGPWRDRNIMDKSNDKYPNNKLPFKFSSHEALNRSHPILTIRNKQFEHIEENALDPECLQDLPTFDEYIPKLSRFTFEREEPLERAELPPISTKKWEPISASVVGYFKANKVHKGILLDEECERITSFTVRPGLIQITKDELIFVNEYPQAFTTSKPKNGLFHYKIKDHTPLINKWQLEDIRELTRRRYICNKTALEIRFVSNKSILLNFFTQEKMRIVEKKLVRARRSNLQYHGTLDPKKLIRKTRLIENWAGGKISNFDYLMALNSLAGRSLHDIAQYPVFPWIISNYTLDKLNIKDKTVFRDLTLNVGSLGSSTRISHFLHRFEEDTESNNRFHFGSHYSTPGSVLFFLLRLPPFSEGNLELFSGRFDLPERLFNSIGETYRSVTEDITDVRELIPEFYYMPEMLVNSEKYNFGEKENGKVVADLDLPLWAKKDPYYFTYMLRCALESEKVTASLHCWIDLIFGYKQKGKEAQKAMNLFYPVTYVDDLDLDLIQDPFEKDAIHTQVLQFGQIPTQLFTKPHPSKMRASMFSVADSNVSMRKYVPKAPEKTKSSKPSPVLKVKFVKENKIVGIRENGIAFEYIWSPCAHDTSPTTPFTLASHRDHKVKLNTSGTKERLNFWDRTVIDRFNCPILLLGNGKEAVVGGINNSYNSHFTLHNLFSKDVPVSYQETTTVTVLATDQKEKIILVGSKSGEFSVWKRFMDKQHLSKVHSFMHHDDVITSIYISDQLQLCATASLDATINLYGLFSWKLFRTIIHPRNIPIHNVLIGHSPLPCIVIFSQEDKTWITFGINGKILGKCKEEAKYSVSPIIIDDSNYHNFLTYGNERGQVVRRMLPYFKEQNRWEILNSPVVTLMTSPDQRFLFVGLDDGNLVVMTDASKLKHTGTELNLMENAFNN